MAAVLVVEDDAAVRDVVEAACTHLGHDVVSVASGLDALVIGRRQPVDVIVLDVGLPGIDGFETCRQLRATGVDAPVLFLTARTAIEDLQDGYAAGADDYLRKPFAVEELVLRLESLLRRDTEPIAASAGNRVLRFADLVVDVDGARVTRADQPITLTATEFRLLVHLMDHEGHVRSREQLFDAVWTDDRASEPAIVETYVSYLRRKLDVGTGPLIHTVRGLGYVLRADA